MILTLAKRSVLNRKGSVTLTLVSIIIGISLLLLVEHIRVQAKESFNRTVSGVDLIMGARTGQLNLLLYSVFRIGNATNSVAWDSFEAVQANPRVAWAVPIALGDSHRGYRVMGTSSQYFDHYKYGNKRPLEFASGQAFDRIFEAVIGAEVAAKLNYQVGDEIVLSHGTGGISFTNHDYAPFVVSGILQATGTPVDKTVHVSLAGIEAVHLSPPELAAVLAAYKRGENVELRPTVITAAMLGLTSRIATFQVQRQINQYPEEPLLAILPGVALSELWQIIGTVENLLRLITVLILLSSLLGLSTMLLASMRERRREMAVLRAIGAGPLVIFFLIQVEALLVVLTALVASVLLIWFSLSVSTDWLASQFGLYLDTNIFTANSLYIAGFAIVATLVVAMIPAIGAYRQASGTSMYGS